METLRGQSHKLFQFDVDESSYTRTTLRGQSHKLFQFDVDESSYTRTTLRFASRQIRHRLYVRLIESQIREFDNFLRHASAKP